MSNSGHVDEVELLVWPREGSPGLKCWRRRMQCLEVGLEIWQVLQEALVVFLKHPQGWAANRFSKMRWSLAIRVTTGAGRMEFVKSLGLRVQTWPVKWGCLVACERNPGLWDPKLRLPCCLVISLADNCLLHVVSSGWVLCPWWSEKPLAGPS